VAEREHAGLGSLTQSYSSRRFPTRCHLVPGQAKLSLSRLGWANDRGIRGERATLNPKRSNPTWSVDSDLGCRSLT